MNQREKAQALHREQQQLFVQAANEGQDLEEATARIRESTRDAWLSVLREEAPKQRNLTIERMKALEAEARRRAQQAVSPEEHDRTTL